MIQNENRYLRLTAEGRLYIKCWGEECDWSSKVETGPDTARRWMAEFGEVCLVDSRWSPLRFRVIPEESQVKLRLHMKQFLLTSSVNEMAKRHGLKDVGIIDQNLQWNGYHSGPSHTVWHSAGQRPIWNRHLQKAGISLCVFFQIFYLR